MIGCLPLQSDSGAPRSFLMSFQVIECPSGAVFFKGKLTQKKLAAKSKRSLYLCMPKTTEDIAALHDELTLGMALKKNSEEVTPEQIEAAVQENLAIYGHLSLSAISGYPLLVIGSNAKTFCHFSQIQGLLDEHDLNQACSFALKTSTAEFRFTAESSTAYQQWIGALSQAYENINARAGQFRPSSPLSMGRSTPMSRNPDEYLEMHKSVSSRRMSQIGRTRSESESLYSRKSRDLSSVSLPAKKSFFAKVKSFFKKEKMEPPVPPKDGIKEKRKSFSFFATE